MDEDEAQSETQWEEIKRVLTPVDEDDWIMIPATVLIFIVLNIVVWTGFGRIMDALSVFLTGLFQ